MIENQPRVRDSLLEAALWFVQAAVRLSGVQRIALIGSIISDRQNPKDIDLVVYIADDADLAPLAAVARRLQGRLQSQNRGSDVFLANERRHYLGRVCCWKVCRPGVRASCDALHCGRRPYLHDDLATIRLPDSLIAAPLLELWPVVLRRCQVPADVEQLVSRLPPPHNNAFDRAAGSRSLATAGQRERSANSEGSEWASE
jgi:predicted nucleotidyltransferase